MEEKEISEKEKRIRTITRIYYSNPKVQAAILKFALDREVVPRYFEGFGKRPDMLQYVSDIDGLVRKGATSFHASEELWNDPLQLSSDSTLKDLENLRKGWDFLIDIDSKYFDLSKILARLILESLENHGVKNYGLKFSGSKGLHIMVSSKAFPREFNGFETSKMFPAWPRAICQYLMNDVRKEYNQKARVLFGEDIKKIEEDTKTSKEDFLESLCPVCNNQMKKGVLVVLKCPYCKTTVQRKDMKITKKRLKCVQESCAGEFEVVEQKDYFWCEHCDISSINKKETSGRYATTYTDIAKKQEDYSKDISEELSGSFFGASDLVLVASRHLFRMPYSLHEKTALASVVLTKEELENFSPKDADPLKVDIGEFMPKNEPGEAKNLLAKALEWNKEREVKNKEFEDKRFSNYKDKKFEDVEMKGVTEEMFPQPIKKLLKGLEEGRKRGLFVLLTFLRSTGFSAEEVNKRVREWNEKNSPPLREGYVRSQIEWHLKQTKKILPPNYSNDAFYRDIGILDKKPETKNPLVDVMRKIRRRPGSESF